MLEMSKRQINVGSYVSGKDGIIHAKQEQEGEWLQTKILLQTSLALAASSLVFVACCDAVLLMVSY
jgi:hypothetical protein